MLGIRKSDSDGGLALKNLYLDADGVAMTQQNNYCLTAMVPMKVDASDAAGILAIADDTNGKHQPPDHIQKIGSGTNGYSYCVAQFFVYYAQDINK